MPVAQAFRRLVRTVVAPAFREAVDAARARGFDASVEVELGGVQPRALFYLRPSGRSIRYELDFDGQAVREIEGVYLRALGQRHVWTDVETLERRLTAGYARLAAFAVVEDEFQALAGPRR
jgi:hypothetical protein